jgi:hypothetical protein
MSKRASHGLVAALLAAAVALTVYRAVPPGRAPVLFTSLLHGRIVHAIDIEGGARLVYRVSGGDAARAAEAISSRSDLRAEAEDDRVAIEAPGLSEAEARASLATLGAGELTLELVAHDVHRPGCAAAERDPLAAAQGIEVERESWTSELGPVGDCFLLAASRDALERYLERVPFAPQPGHAVAIERVGANGDLRGEYFRTYVVRGPPVITGRDVERATVVVSHYTGRHEVLVDLTGAGASAFAEATGRHIGHKLAIRAGGEVFSAPVIAARIDGGQLSIAMGNLPRRAERIAAQTLAWIFERGPMAGDLELIEAAAALPTASPARVRAALISFAALLGAAAGLLLFLALRLARSDPALAAAADPLPRARWPRLLATLLGAAAVVWLLPWVGLLGVDPGELAELTGLGVERANLGAFALGLMPVISAFLLVELAALAIPRWRPLRIGGPAGRATLARATAAVAVIVALAQGWIVAELLGRFSGAPGLPDFAGGLSWRLMTTATLAAAAFAYVVIIWLIDRFGLGNGYSIAIGAASVATLAEGVGSRDALAGLSLLPASEIALVVAAVVLPLALTALLLRWRARGSGKLRLPACGVVPLAAFQLLASGIVVLSWIGVYRPALAGVGGTGLGAAAALIAAVAFSLLFSRSRPLAPMARVVHDRGESLALWPAVVASTAYIGLLVALQVLVARSAPWLLLAPLSSALLAAIALDVAAEWRARAAIDDPVAVWPLHRVQLADLATGALRSAGIEVHPRGLYHRSLLHFFGPFVPVALMVPRAQAQQAHELLAALLIPGGDACRGARSAAPD